MGAPWASTTCDHQGRVVTPGSQGLRTLAGGPWSQHGVRTPEPRGGCQGAWVQSVLWACALVTGLSGFQDFHGAVVRVLDEMDYEGKDLVAREELRRGLSELPAIHDLHQEILEELEERLAHW